MTHPRVLPLSLFVSFPLPPDALTAERCYHVIKPPEARGLRSESSRPPGLVPVPCDSCMNSLFLPETRVLKTHVRALKAPYSAEASGKTHVQVREKDKRESNSRDLLFEREDPSRTLSGTAVRSRRMWSVKQEQNNTK